MIIGGLFCWDDLPGDLLYSSIGKPSMLHNFEGRVGLQETCPDIPGYDPITATCCCGVTLKKDAHGHTPLLLVLKLPLAAPAWLDVSLAW